ncbi:phosphate signaling complex protein PhoU [Nosocomiicoccus ampullae]|uniref:Phosphate-specific transport system accessory protein PhoU n=1 Tax=Nosocomiicoccus ampullae TaxID=489910 RepID=A0A9Q2CZL1_9STAP|nr:phosphate signaling complex protein PhoU [Nosocomiicoccus ampullae]MBB5176434.1 phosphate transport system protein [Nosocomiicoccus ampullae]QYA47587.1 phosphate signaling complex protein PhoU [Nosocomiicoccus ampullae]QYA49217.1 phosphate signaling complex protein PhoU [Nosocomiicoccus ampullae]
MKQRKQFLNHLDDLTSTIFKMSHEVEVRIHQLIEQIEKRDEKALKDLAIEDIHVNDLEILINEKIVSIITLEAPVASDLRMLISYIKIAEDLERISDNVVNVANILAKHDIEHQEIKNKLVAMLKLCELMLIDVTSAMKTKDLPLVREIMTRDEDIDAIYLEITSSSIYEIDDRVLMSQVSLITKFIERIGDHIENIGEHLFFYLTGQQYQ